METSDDDTTCRLHVDIDDEFVFLKAIWTETNNVNMYVPISKRRLFFSGGENRAVVDKQRTG